MAQVRSDRNALGRRRHGPLQVRPAKRSGTALPALALIRNTLLDSDGPAEDLTDRLNQNLLGDTSPLFIADPGGALLYANRAYRRIEETLVASGECPPAEQVAASIGSTGAPLQRELTVEVNGRTRSYALEQHLLHDHAGELLAVVGRLDSIDEPKRLRASLALSEERFNDIARLVSDWVWETDRTLTLTYVSPRVINALGYHPRELLGRHLGELTSEPNDLGDRGGITKGQAPFRGAKVVLRHRDGENRTFKLSGLPVYCRESGDFVGFRGTAQDVTELLAHEAALQKAVDAAEAANRIKSEFLANTSHELRTPLNAIIGFSEIMHLEKFGPIGNARYQEYAGNVLESAQHLLTLINDILDVAKIEAGKLELEEAPVHPAELGRQALRLVADRAQRAGVALEAVLPDDLPRLLIDGRKVKQILLNLLSNAIKFTPRGGCVGLSASHAKDGGFAFAVSDTGIGIAPEDQMTALTPFGQVDSQLARKFEGTGLGLPLSSALAELHGGSLELDSAPSQGTTVTIRLPARRILED
jgi:PAS domain S-box-containing protein